MRCKSPRLNGKCMRNYCQNSKTRRFAGVRKQSVSPFFLAARPKTGAWEQNSTPLNERFICICNITTKLQNRNMYRLF